MLKGGRGGTWGAGADCVGHVFSRSSGAGGMIGEYRCLAAKSSSSSARLLVLDWPAALALEGRGRFEVCDSGWCCAVTAAAAEAGQRGGSRHCGMQRAIGTEVRIHRTRVVQHHLTMIANYDKK